MDIWLVTRINPEFSRVLRQVANPTFWGPRGLQRVSIKQIFGHFGPQKLAFWGPK
jgi:hypothetical protein